MAIRTTTFGTIRKPNRDASLLAAAFCVLALATGCSGLYRQVPPAISLVDLRFTDITVFETSGVMVLRLSNENPDPMAIEGGAYNLYIDGVRVGQGLSNASFDVPRLASEIDEVPFRVNNIAFATRLKRIIDEGSFGYTIKAKVYVAGSFGRKTLRVTKDGYFDFAKAAEDPAFDPGASGPRSRDGTASRGRSISPRPVPGSLRARGAG